MKAAKAQQANRFVAEITPVEISINKKETAFFAADEFIKPNTSVEKLAQLKPAFKKEGGSVTAGNSSGLNDGAAAMYVVSEQALKRFSLTPKARIVSSAVVGVEPRIMGIGPVNATKKALAKAGLTLEDMDIMELNEAFAAQSIACIRALGLRDDDPRINPNGGAIALGHPLGMSGTRIINTAAIELHKQQKKYALATMCIGVGMGYAVIIERL
jgi:acetyl-CoA acetyltransferase family protein